jgi:hypothetical protein
MQGQDKRISFECARSCNTAQRAAQEAAESAGQAAAVSSRPPGLLQARVCAAYSATPTVLYSSASTVPQQGARSSRVFAVPDMAAAATSPALCAKVDAALATMVEKNGSALQPIETAVRMLTKVLSNIVNDGGENVKFRRLCAHFCRRPLSPAPPFLTPCRCACVDMLPPGARPTPR